MNDEAKKMIERRNFSDSLPGIFNPKKTNTKKTVQEKKQIRKTGVGVQMDFFENEDKKYGI